MLELNSGLIFSILNLLVLFWLLKKFLFGPVINIIEAREQMIKQQMDTAKDREITADMLLAQQVTALSEATEEAESIVNRARLRAKDESVTIVQEANAEARRVMSQAKGDIEKERAKAVRGVSAELVSLAVAVASKAVAGKESGVFDRELMDAFLKEEGASNDDNGR